MLARRVCTQVGLVKSGGWGCFGSEQVNICDSPVVSLFATNAATGSATGMEAGGTPPSTAASAPQLTTPAVGLQLPSATEAATVAAAGTAVLAQVAALGGASPAAVSAVIDSGPGAVLLIMLTEIYIIEHEEILLWKIQHF